MSKKDLKKIKKQRKYYASKLFELILNENDEHFSSKEYTSLLRSINKLNQIIKSCNISMNNKEDHCSPKTEIKIENSISMNDKEPKTEIKIENSISMNDKEPKTEIKIENF